MKSPTFGNWTFKSATVGKEFDAHVREQLPWYELVTSAVSHIATHYIPERATVYDLGCSTGNVARSLHDVIEARKVNFIGIDSSEEMIKRYDAIGTPIRSHIEEYEYAPFDLAICNLSLMFLSPCARSTLIETLRAKRKPGGAILIVERFATTSGYLATVMMRLTLVEKLKAGARPEDILEKELSLSGVQVPLSETEIPNAHEWFRFGDFAGLIITDETEQAALLRETH